MATKLAGSSELAAPAWTTCTLAILPCRKRRLAVGRTRMTSAVLRPAHPQKNQQSGSSAILPSRMYPSAGGSVSPRSHRETAIAEVLKRLPSSPWVSFSAWRNARILRDHSGRPFADFRSIIFQPFKRRSNLHITPTWQKANHRTSEGRPSPVGQNGCNPGKTDWATSCLNHGRLRVKVNGCRGTAVAENARRISSPVISPVTIPS